MNPSRTETLDRELLRAHAARDHHGLVDLYQQAADLAASQDRMEAAAFYLTHAYVFALETGDARATEIHAVLKAWGREQ